MRNRTTLIKNQPDYFLLVSCIASVITFYTYIWQVIVTHYKPHISPDIIFTPDMEALHPEIEATLYFLGWLLGISASFFAYYCLNNYLSKRLDTRKKHRLSKGFFALSLIALLAVFYGFDTHLRVDILIVPLSYLAIVSLYLFGLEEFPQAVKRTFYKSSVALLGITTLFIFISIIIKHGPIYDGLMNILKDEMLLTNTGYSQVEAILTISSTLVFVGILVLCKKTIANITKNKFRALLIDSLVVLAIIVAIFDIYYSIFNVNYLIGAVNDVLGGKTMLVDSQCQYGLLPIYAIALPFKIFHIPLTYGNFALLNTITYIVAYLTIYLILRAWLKNILISVFGIFLITQQNYFLGAPLGFPQSGFLRFGCWIPVMLILLIRIKLDTKNTNYYLRNTIKILELLLVATAFFWSFDSGIYVLVAYGAAIFIETFENNAEIKIQLKKLLLKVGQILGALLFLFIAISVFTYIRSHQWPDWYQYIQYVLIYSSNGVGMIPMPKIGLHLLFLVLYISSASYIVLKLFFTNEKGQRDLPILSFITAYGIMSFIYYVGRSHPNNLHHIVIPAIIIICWFILKGTNYFASESGKEFFKRNMLVMSSSLMLIVLLITLPILVSSKEMILNLSGRETIVRIKERDDIKWLIADPNKQVEYENSVRAIEENENGSDDVAIISSLDTLFLVATHRTNVMNSNNLPQEVLRSQIEQLGNELLTAKPESIYIDHDPLSPAFAMSYWNGKKVILLMHMIGVDVPDSNGENHAIPFNAPTVAGVIDQARYFNGTDTYIATPLSFEEWSNITVSFWIKPEPSEVEGSKFILGNDSGTENNFVIRSTDNTETRFVWSCAGGEVEFDLQSGKWSHVIVIADANNNKLEVYEDDNKIAEGDLPNGLNFDSTPLIFGKSPTTDASYFNGSIDEVAIWDSALTQDDIYTLSDFYDSSSSTDNNQLLSDAKVLWQMNETETSYRFEENVGWLDRYVLK